MRISDWSSDVCSSDLAAAGAFRVTRCQVRRRGLCASLLPEEDTENQQSRYRLGRETLPRRVEGVRTMSKQRFTSVWDAIEDTPEEAENMKLRSVLMTALKNHLTRTEERRVGKECVRTGKTRW